MSEASAQAFPIGQAAPVILWGLRHAKDLPTVREKFNDVGEARNLLPKWEAFKVSGDFLTGSVLYDLPGVDDFVNRIGSRTFEVGALAMHKDVNDVFTFSACGTALTEANIQAVAEAHGLAIGDGTIIRIVFENLPAILSAIVQLFNLFKG